MAVDSEIIRHDVWCNNLNCSVERCSHHKDRELTCTVCFGDSTRPGTSRDNCSSTTTV